MGKPTNVVARLGIGRPGWFEETLSGETLGVLLVEDSADYALLVEQTLGDEFDGFLELTVCDTLAAAARRLEEAAPDCVLLDLSLPDADGL